MVPVGNPSLFMRFFGLAENYPLYAMVGIACGLAVYTPIRHLTGAPDVAIDLRARNHGDNLASSPRYLERSRRYYDMNAPLSTFAHVSEHSREACSSLGSSSSCPVLDLFLTDRTPCLPRLPSRPSHPLIPSPLCRSRMVTSRSGQRLLMCHTRQWATVSITPLAGSHASPQQPH